MQSVWVALDMASHPTVGDLQIINRIAVFRGLKPETVEHIIASATAVTLKAHSTLFRQGDPATAFFIMIDGWTKHYRINSSGDETVIHVLTKGDSFAEFIRLNWCTLPGNGRNCHRCQDCAGTRRSCRSLHPRKSEYCAGYDRIDVTTFAEFDGARRAAQGAEWCAAARRISRIARIGRHWSLRHRFALRQRADSGTLGRPARIAVPGLRQVEICRGRSARCACSGERRRQASPAGHGSAICDPGDVP